MQQTRISKFVECRLPLLISPLGFKRTLSLVKRLLHCKCSKQLELELHSQRHTAIWNQLVIWKYINRSIKHRTEHKPNNDLISSLLWAFFFFILTFLLHAVEHIDGHSTNYYPNCISHSHFCSQYKDINLSKSFKWTWFGCIQKTHVFYLFLWCQFFIQNAKTHHHMSHWLYSFIYIIY